MEEQQSAAAPQRSKKRHGSVMKKLVMVLVMIIPIVLAAYFFVQWQDVKKNPDKASNEQVKSLVDKVNKLITLPTDEQPTVATVQDKEKLKEQPFFSQAENGDKLLIYTKAQKAIIYRENGNKLINVGPVTIDTEAAAQQSQQSTTENKNQ